MDNDTFNLHIDYVDGKVYTEIEDGVPVFSELYSESPICIMFSQPCRCITSDRRNTEAVYVIAISCAMNNDGTRDDWRGFVEVPKDKKDDDWSFVENVFKEELTLDVNRWHYIGEEPISYLKQLSICEQGSTAL